MVKIRYADFQTLTKRRTLDVPTDDEEVILRIATDIVDQVGELDRGVRLLGITLTNLEEKAHQVSD